jgi:DNA-binding NarL/FixJ family response regulator
VGSFQLSAISGQPEGFGIQSADAVNIVLVVASIVGKQRVAGNQAYRRRDIESPAPNRYSPPQVPLVGQSLLMSPSAASTAVGSGASSLSLPLRMKVLFITAPDHAGGWLAEAFASDGAAHVVFEETASVAAGLARLRDEVFDAVVVRHHADSINAIDLVEALRAGGNDEPLLILGDQPPHDLDALCYEAGADDYCCIAETTVRGLLWKLARAIQRFTLTRENRRLLQAERQRLHQEHHEAERLLEQQRALIEDLEDLREGFTGPPPRARRTKEGGVASEDDPVRSILEQGDSNPFAHLNLPPELTTHYQELLRAYVIMGAGNLSHEMSTLARLLAEANVSAQRTMQLHLDVLEELVGGLGNRSARHVMNRADLLALEVMSHLADNYRQRYHDRDSPSANSLAHFPLRRRRPAA